jgi:hypothetical protein
VAQIFHPRFTLILQLALLGTFSAIGIALLVYRVNIRSGPALSSPVEQPVAFSHKHHVRDDGIDCRYCHVSVETSAFAGIPPLSPCMTCHSQLFTKSPMLAPLVDAFRGTRPLRWNRVHKLPDFVFFNHSIHIAKGVGCVTCHGRIDEMPLTRRVVSLDMQWCLDCHRAPEKYLRPREHVFDMDWPAPTNQLEAGRMLKTANRIRSAVELTDCSICHR